MERNTETGKARFQESGNAFYQVIDAIGPFFMGAVCRCVRQCVVNTNTAHMIPDVGKLLPFVSFAVRVSPGCMCLQHFCLQFVSYF